MLERLFKLRSNKTTVRTEIFAGIVTFLSMSYILAVNPGMLSVTGMDAQGVFLATALSAAVATLLMGLLANYPIALASGMGLNAYFAYTICCGEMAGNPNAWKVALTAILVEGLIFILMSFSRFREGLVNAIPANLKLGISSGIGLFITFVGLQNAGVAIADPSTLLALGDLSTPQVALALAGTLLIAIMMHYRVKGAILWGILITWGLGVLAELTGWYVVDAASGAPSLIPAIESARDFLPGFSALKATAFQFDFSYIAENTMHFVMILFTFLYLDIFDTVGTLIGVGSHIGIINEKGQLPRANRALLADAVGTVFGACLGTCTVTSYMESTTGVVEGGRTGLTAVSTAVMFVLAIFLWPIFRAIPGFATAPALIIVGMLMMTSVLKMDFTRDKADALAGFLAMIVMPFTYSIANGIMVGVLSWSILKIATGKGRDIPPIIWVSFALFVLRIISLVV